MLTKKTNIYKISLASILAVSNLLPLACNQAYAAAEIVSYADMAVIDQAEVNIAIPPNLNLSTTESASVPKAALVPEAQQVLEATEIKETFSAPKSVINDSTILSTMMQAEVHKDVKAKDKVFSDNLALAIPSPTLFRSIEEEIIIREEEPIIIDNDELVEVEATIKYKDMPTDGGKTKILTGAKFPVVVCSQINSKTANEGDPFEARLKYDLKIGDRLIAKKGAVVNGHLNYVLRARCALHSLVSPEHWYRNSGRVGVSFDEIINDKGEHLPLVATPAQSARIVKNKGEGRVLGVNHLGQVAGPWSQQLRYKAIRVGLNFAMAPAGVFSFGAMPVALGVMGAVNPSFAFMKPVGLNVRHRRIKGFAWGFLSGIPGSWLIEDTVVRGQEAVIKPGDEFLVEFKEEFTGEPATEASLIAGAKAKVHGQVVNKPARKKKISQTAVHQ